MDRTQWDDGHHAVDNQDAPEAVPQETPKEAVPSVATYSPMVQQPYSSVPGQQDQEQQGQVLQQSGASSPPDNGLEKSTPERKIWGLRRSTFFLTVALLAVIVVAAIGGGVGGSIAVKNAKR